MTKVSTPRSIIQGFNDQSREVLPPSPIESPQHEPLFYIKASKGTLVPTDITGADPLKVFGDDVFDVRSPHHTHANEALRIALAQGNQCLVKRVVSGAYAEAGVTLAVTVDTSADVINEYDREVDGTVKTDVNGDPLFLGTFAAGGAKLTYSLISKVTDPTPTGSGDVITYPLLSITHSDIGVVGNNDGFRLWHAGPNSVNPGDTEIVADQEALIFNASIVRRETNGSSAVIEDLFSTRMQEFCFKPKSFSYKTRVDLTIQDLVTKYADDGFISQTVPEFGPLAQVEVHQSNLETVLDALLAVENTLAPEATTRWMLNFLDGKNIDGVEHYAFQVDSAGLRLTEDRTHYLIDGADGDMDYASYDTAVGLEVENNSSNSDYPLVDMAKYSFNAVYDSGYSLATKEKLLGWLGLRENTHVTLGTHVVGEASLTPAEEISVGIYLRSQAILYAESAYFGTPACRVVIMAHSGELVSSTYKERVPLTFELLHKRAGYMGAANGIMKGASNYETSPGNHVQITKNVTNAWMTNSTTDAVWAAGLTFVKNMDKATLFFPSIRTVYSLENSVLTSEIPMMIGCTVKTILDRVYRMLTNDSKLTDSEFKQKGERLITNLTRAGIFDNRVTIVPRIYFTADDVALGYSWHMEATIYATPSRKVANSVVVIKRRKED